MSLEEQAGICKSSSLAELQQQSKLPYTDLGNAKRLVHRHGSDIRYSHASKQWFCWDGRRWARDVSGEIQRRAKEAALSIFDERPLVADSQAEALREHAARSQSAGSLRAMIDLACSEPGIPIASDAFDRHPLLLNVANGTIELDTGELRPSRREDLLSKMTQVEFEASATCPLWHAFLSRAFPDNERLANFVQRVSGYALTGLTNEQSFFLVVGGGANGKSTFLNILLALLGDYGLQTPTETVMARRDNSIPNDVARLKGSRIVTAIETDSDRHLSEARVKQFTGEDRVAARFLFGEWFEFIPEFKLFLAVNHVPKIEGGDEAIWRRVVLIPFTETIPEGERDRELAKKLRAELPGVLNWAVKGCKLWRSEGLNIPPEVREATTEYRLEMDDIAGFLEECCVIDPEAQIEKERLYTKFKSWCASHREKPLSKRSFGVRILEHGFTDYRTSEKRFWRGLRGRPMSFAVEDQIKG